MPDEVYAIALGGATPSTLNLPMLPYRHFQAVRSVMLAYPWNEGQRAVGGPHAEPFALPLDWGGKGRNAGTPRPVHISTPMTRSPQPQP